MDDVVSMLLLNAELLVVELEDKILRATHADAAGDGVGNMAAESVLTGLETVVS
jgi:hypothetical protein